MYHHLHWHDLRNDTHNVPLCKIVEPMAAGVQDRYALAASSILGRPVPWNKDFLRHVEETAEDIETRKFEGHGAGRSGEQRRRNCNG